jgi:hypothetical protein
MRRRTLTDNRPCHEREQRKTELAPSARMVGCIEQKFMGDELDEGGEDEDPGRDGIKDTRRDRGIARSHRDGRAGSETNGHTEGGDEGVEASGGEGNPAPLRREAEESWVKG